MVSGGTAGAYAGWTGGEAGLEYNIYNFGKNIKNCRNCNIDLFLYIAYTHIISSAKITEIAESIIGVKLWT